MAYSENTKVIYKVESVLKLLLATPNEFTVPSKSPRKLAYYLYNAIWLAAKRNIKPYDDLEGKWKFKAQDDKLLCRPVADVFEAVEEVDFHNLDDSLEVVSAIQNNPFIKRYIFSNVSLLTSEEIKSWAEVNNFTHHYDAETATLTVSRS
jgi:hypothetical protein